MGATFNVSEGDEAETQLQASSLILFMLDPIQNSAWAQTLIIINRNFMFQQGPIIS